MSKYAANVFSIYGEIRFEPDMSGKIRKVLKKYACDIGRSEPDVMTFSHMEDPLPGECGGGLWPAGIYDGRSEKALAPYVTSGQACFDYGCGEVVHTFVFNKGTVDCVDGYMLHT